MKRSYSEMAEHNKRDTFPLLSLPKEVQCIVFLLLDPFSINNLIKAIPSLSELFIVVSDLTEGAEYGLDIEYPVSHFWSCKVEVCSFTDYTELRKEAGYVTPHLITLFDVTTSFSGQDGFEPGEGLSELLTEQQIPSDNSVLYYAVRGENTHVLEREIIREAMNTLRKLSSNCYIDYWPWSSPPAVTESAREPMSTRDLVGFSKISWNRLRTLELMNVSSINDLKVDQVTELSIHISTEASTPSIYKLWAPRAAIFSIHYRDEFPRISKSEIGTYSCHDGCHTRTLLLIHVDALKELDDPLPPCSTPLSVIQNNVDLSFTRNFRSLVIIGGHDELLFKMANKDWDSLTWKRANVQPWDSRPITDLKLTVRNNFWFETLVPNTLMPRVKMRFPFKSLTLVNRAPGFDSNGFCNALQYLYFIEDFGVHNHTDRWPDDRHIEVPGKLLHHTHRQAHELIKTTGKVLLGVFGPFRGF